MCGGVGYKTKNISEDELRKFYSEELVKRFKSSGRIESFFWQKNAVLPINTKEGVRLSLWGNKDKNIKMPKTGWARIESLNSGRWDYLNPEEVEVLVDFSNEKGIWLDMPKGTRGIVVGGDKEKRVYMITKNASKDYKDLTGHDREPV